MDWSNEEYVRLYTRETADDLDLSWEALALWRALLIKFDRAGVINAKSNWVSVARLTRIPIEVVQRAGPELLKDGRLRATSGGFVAPNYIEAQTASKSDKLRQRESRDRRSAHAKSQIIDSTNACHTQSHAVTPSHTASQNVTLCSALLCSAEPLLCDTVAEAMPIMPAAPAPKAKSNKCRLAPDWQPARTHANLEAERIAIERGVDVALEIQKLRDWAVGGSVKKADWDATWRNWTRNARAQHSGQQRTPLEIQLERVRMLEELERNGDDGDQG